MVNPIIDAQLLLGSRQLTVDLVFEELNVSHEESIRLDRILD